MSMPRIRRLIVVMASCLIAAAVMAAGPAPVPGNAPASGKAAAPAPPRPVPPVAAGAHVKFGESVKKVPLTYERWNKKSEAPAILICGFHGDERLAHRFCTKVIDQIRLDPSILKGRHLLTIHTFNPDGLSRGTRGNQNGVDLNRNFDANWQPAGKGKRYNPGPSPLSEPESQALARLIDQEKPSLVITVHQPMKMINYDGPAEEIANLMARHNHYRVSGSIGYPTPGSFGNFTGVARRIPSICLELPGGSDLSAVWKGNFDAVMAAITYPAPAPAPAPVAPGARPSPRSNPGRPAPDRPSGGPPPG